MTQILLKLDNTMNNYKNVSKYGCREEVLSTISLRTFPLVDLRRGFYDGEADYHQFDHH